MELTQSEIKLVKKFQERFLERTLHVIKENIDNNKIKNQLYTISESDVSVYVMIKSNQYEKVLDEMLDHFIKLERYEDCQDIIDYKQKLNELQNGINTTTAKDKL